MELGYPAIGVDGPNGTKAIVFPNLSWQLGFASD
jgi:hypothetical protein